MGLLQDSLLLFSKPGCELCDKLEAQLEADFFVDSADFQLIKVDISEDSALLKQFGETIPVLAKGEAAEAYLSYTEEAFSRISPDISSYPSNDFLFFPFNKSEFQKWLERKR